MNWFQRILSAVTVPAPEVVTTAACPACECVHSVGMFVAKSRGGTGQRVVSKPTGEVVRCCGCGTQYTVLASGEVLRGRGAERSAPPSSKATNGRVPSGRVTSLDEDINDLTPELPW